MAENGSFEKETDLRRDVVITGQAGVEERKVNFEETIGNPLRVRVHEVSFARRRRCVPLWHRSCMRLFSRRETWELPEGTGQPPYSYGWEGYS